MAGYKNAANVLTDWNNPSVCAIACDVGTPESDSKCNYGGGYTRVVLYQDGSTKAQGSNVGDAITVGVDNGDTSGTIGTSLKMLQRG